MTADQRLLRTEEMARLLGVAPRTIRRWAADGTLPAPVRKGCRYTRWRLADVQRFLGDNAADAVLTPSLRDFLILIAKHLSSLPPPVSEQPGQPESASKAKREPGNVPPARSASDESE